MTAGYHAVAIDYFGRTAGVGEFDRSLEEHAEASADAWRRVLDFLGKVGAGALT